MYIERTSIAIECTKCTIVLHWTAMSSRVCLEESDELFDIDLKARVFL
jgi:hypothetical protein